MANIPVNGTARQIDVEPETPLLWVLREERGLTGTKFGCGIAECGACTVHVDGVAIRSCSVPVRTVEGKQITEEPEEAPKAKVLDLMAALKQSLEAAPAEEKEKPGKRRKVAGKR